MRGFVVQLGVVRTELLSLAENAAAGTLQGYLIWLEFRLCAWVTISATADFEVKPEDTTKSARTFPFTIKSSRGVGRCARSPLKEQLIAGSACPAGEIGSRKPYTRTERCIFWL